MATHSLRRDLPWDVQRDEMVPCSVEAVVAFCVRAL
eukprot:COSAG06_NODE_63447_length_262_cov_0.638037_1_plen_35_part_10